MRKHRKSVFKVMLCTLILTMVLAIMPIRLEATGTTQLIVNGEDMDVVNGETMVCGTGSAEFDAKTSTLTLTNAEITKTDESNHGGIFFSGFRDPLTIVLKGKNSIISPSGDTDIYVGIMALNALNIVGDGELIIKTKGLEDSATQGIIVNKGNFHISDVKLTFENLTEQRNPKAVSYDAAIATNVETVIKNASITSNLYDSVIHSSASVTLKDSQVESVDNFDNSTYAIAGGINVDDNSGGNAVLNITNSKVHITNPDTNAIYCSNDIFIGQNSSITTNSPWVGVYSGFGNITISESKVDATSTENNSIYATKGVSIQAHSEVVTKSKDNGIYANGDMTIDKSKVDAISTNDYALFSKSAIAILDSDIHAKAGAQKPAIVVRVVKTIDEASTSKITVDSQREDTLARIAFTDWFQRKTEQCSVTSFVAKNESELKTDLSNALNEVTITMKSADYTKVDAAIAKIPADLSKYTKTSVTILNNAKNAVVRDKLITEQSTVDGYATAIEQAIQGLQLTSELLPETKLEIIEGNNQTIEKGNEASFKANGLYKDFQKVLIDGMEISSEHYIVKDGSIIVTLKATYTKTLHEGKHTICIVTTKGQAESEFTILKEIVPTIPPTTNNEVPKTWDKDNGLIGIVLTSLLSALILILMVKKRSVKQ